MLNKHYQNIGLKAYFKRYGYINGLKRLLFSFNRFHFVKDYENRKLLWQRKAKKKVEKYYKYKDSDVNDIIFNSNIDTTDTIWIYWNKGYENAPFIVQKCIDSVKKYHNNVILIDENNIKDYLIFPSYIEEKFSKGKISIAAYSDLIRFTLLEHYGGTWIDSTVLLTGEIPNYILKSDIFFMKNSIGLMDNPVLYPIWFIHSNKHNEVIKSVRNISFAYWKKENHVIEYLLSNLICTMVIENSNYSSNIPYMNSDYSEFLIKKLADDYDEEAFNWVLSLTNIHKLTYKLDENIKNCGFYRKVFTKDEL